MSKPSTLPVDLCPHSMQWADRTGFESKQCLDRETCVRAARRASFFHLSSWLNKEVKMLFVEYDPGT